MPSRTDLLHSYQFRTRRVLAALVMRETDPLHSPLRRGVGAAFGGIMLTLLLAAGFGVYGLITKVGGDAWRVETGAVVVERETGATYVYLDGTLYPTLNLASAMLVAGPTVHRVSSRSLASVARGNVIGIPGAPDSLPPASRRIGLPWTVCAVTETGESPTPVARTVLAVGMPAVGGAPLGDGALVVTNRSASYLIWHGHRFPLPSQDVVTALYGSQAPRTEVDLAWLNALPAGPAIAAPPVQRPGEPSRAAGLSRYTNGTVLRYQTGTGQQHLLVTDDGLVALTDLHLLLLQPVAPTDVNPADIQNELPDPIEPTEADPPAAAPPLVTTGPGAQICATTADSAIATVTVGATVDGLDRATPTPEAASTGRALADRVFLPGGRVSVVHAVETPGAPGGTYLVVTDLGIAYPVAGPDVLGRLGYSPAQAVDVPTPLVSLIPTGPALDPTVLLPPSPQ